MQKEYVICPVHEDGVTDKREKGEVSRTIISRKGSFTYPKIIWKDDLVEKLKEYKKRLIQSVEELITENTRILADHYETEAAYHGNDVNIDIFEFKNGFWTESYFSRRGHGKGERVAKDKIKKVLAGEAYREWDTLTLRLSLPDAKITMNNWLNILYLDEAYENKEDFEFWQNNGFREKFIMMKINGTPENIEKYYLYFKTKLNTHFIELKQPL